MRTSLKKVLNGTVPIIDVPCPHGSSDLCLTFCPLISIVIAYNVLSLLYERALYCEVVTFWRYEVVNKHHTEGNGKATLPVCRDRNHRGFPCKIGSVWYANN